MNLLNNPEWNCGGSIPPLGSNEIEINARNMLKKNKISLCLSNKGF